MLKRLESLFDAKIVFVCVTERKNKQQMNSFSKTFF